MRQGCVFSAGLRFGDWRYAHFTDPDRPDFWRPEPGSVWWCPAEGGALGMRAAAIETVAIEGWIQAEDVVLTGEDGLPLPCLVDIPEVDENGNIVEGTLTPTPSPTPQGYAVVSCEVTSANGRNAPNFNAAVVASYPSGVILPYYEQVLTDLPWCRVSGGATATEAWVAENDQPDGTGTTILDVYPISTWQVATPTVQPGCAPLMTLTPMPTLGPTLTPTIAPTLYPTATSGSGGNLPIPPGLCANTAGPDIVDYVNVNTWIETLCQSSWGYLTLDEQTSLTTAINNGLSTSYSSVDGWYLHNLRRSVQDVPPSAWNVTCDSNDTYCQRVVSDGTFLFYNMARIGIDSYSNGEGQAVVNGDGIPTGDYVSQWFLPSGDYLPASNLKGFTDSRYTCGVQSLSVADYVGDGRADVCWVCADLSTEIIQNFGVDLQAQMESIPELVEQYPNEWALSRLVPSLRRWFRRYGGGQFIPGNSLYSLRVGDLVAVESPNEAANEDERDGHFTHVGIVVRAYEGTDLSAAMDYVLVAQNSYSSRGFYPREIDQYGEDPLVNAPTLFGLPTDIGKFEVVTLRTYLYKTLIAFDEPLSISLANQYLEGIGLPF